METRSTHHSLGFSNRLLKKRTTTFRRSKSINSRSINSRSINSRSINGSKSNVRAANTIKSFFKRTRHTRKAQYLNKMCLDAGVCLAVGYLTDSIKQHFGGFTAFDYVVSPIKRIGSDSANGFINQIKYEHRGYKSYAILKSAKTAEADNLLYEYVVGHQYINQLNKIYPCFLETYGYYMYVDDNAWLTMQNKSTIVNDVKLLKQGLIQQKINYNDACRESSKLAILIQHFENIQSLQDLSNDATFIQEELMNALFQLYIPLAALKDTFTHYDLHLDNIYLYKPVENKYIKYYYWLSASRAIKFKSSYMLKIIDYGRSYFNDIKNNINSQQIYRKELCDYAADCNDDDDDNNVKRTGKCGENVGFGWLKNSRHNPANNYYISSQKKNISHDLLPLARIKINHSAPYPNVLTPELNDLLAKLVYSDFYGTAEITESGFLNSKIYNVRDAAVFITKYVLSQKLQDINEAVYADKACLGELHIYLNSKKPMKFIHFADL